MKKIIFILFLSTVSGGILTAQTVGAYTKAADKAFASKDYFTALVYYKKVLKVQPHRTDIYFKYAESARMFQAYRVAEEAYQNITQSADADRYPLAWYWLGHTKKNLGKYSDAIVLLEKYLEKFKRHNPRFARRAEKDIVDCQWALKYISAANQNTKATPLERGVNTPYSEFGGFQMDDLFYFSSMRFEDRKNDNRLYSKLMYRTSDGVVEEMDFNTKEQFAANATINFDGTKFFYTLCDFDRTGNILCEIVYREKDENGEWGPVQKLPTFINFPGFTATHPTIGFDIKNKREVLFFASNRPGGKGKLDIWYSTMAPNGKFTRPLNLVKMNSRENEATPFFHTPTQTLYYSSDGYKGMGGFDIYRVKKDGQSWQTPVHLSYPINTSYNDFYFVLNEKGDRSFFSSNREEALEIDPENEACCNDIFTAALTPQKHIMSKEELLALAKSIEVLDELSGEPIALEEAEIVENESVINEDLPLRKNTPPKSSASTPIENTSPSATTEISQQNNYENSNNENTVEDNAADTPRRFSVAEILRQKEEQETTATQNEIPVTSPVSNNVSTDEDLPKDLYRLIFKAETFDLDLEPLAGTTVEFIELKNDKDTRRFQKNSAAESKVVFRLRNDVDYKIVLSKPGYYTDTLLIEKEILVGATTLTQKFYLMKLPEGSYFPQSPLVEDLTTKEITEDDLTKHLPIELFFDHNAPDANSWSPTTNKNYEQTYIFYFSKKEKFKHNYAVNFSIAQRENAANEVEDFFSKKLKKGAEELDDFSEKLLEYLKTGNKVELQLQAFTTRRAISDGNNFLLKRRLSCVQNHFKTYRGGALNAYFDNGMLTIRILPKGMFTFEKKYSKYSPKISEVRKVEIKQIIVSY